MRIICVFFVLTAVLLLTGSPPLPQAQTTPETSQASDPAANLYGCSAD
jgi:hypothetical protein